MSIVVYRLAGMQMKCLTQMQRNLTSSLTMILISHNTREYYLSTLPSVCSYTPCFKKKVVHQAHIDNLVNSQRIFKILSLAHSAENFL